MFVLDEKEKASTPPLQLEYATIGTGALALKSTIHHLPFPKIHEEIVLLRKNTRPDVSPHTMLLHIGLKGCDTTLLATPGQKLYLAYEKQNLHFSSATTPIWIKPCINAQLEAYLEIGVCLLSEAGELLLNETQTCAMHHSLQKEGMQKIHSSMLQEGIAMMKKGKWWPPDCLFETYGGEKYKSYIGMERLQFEQPEGGYRFLYVKKDDLFVWKDGEWQSSTITQSYPMAKLTHISPYKMEWTLWDETGLEQVKVIHAKEDIEKSSWRAEELFTQMRQRTTSQVSCHIGGKMKVLKKGDWLIHLPTDWHIVKSAQEMHEVVNFTMQGELFVFDGIEKVEGKSVFCGTFFNKVRSQMLDIKIPFAQGGKNEHPPFIKKSLNTPIKQPPPDEPSIHKQQLKRAYQKSRKRQQPVENHEMVDKK